MTTYGFYYPHHIDGLKDPGTRLGALHQRLTDGITRRMINEGASALVLLSRAQMKIYAEAGFPPEKMHVIPNFVDPKFTSEPMDRSAARTKTLIYTGRLSAEKGVETLIRAYARIASDYPKLRLSIVGTGPLLTDLRNLAGNLGVGGRVSFTGKVPYGSMRDVYRDAFAFVHPGVWPEPFGRSILEAMASGIPVIASNVGSAPEILKDSGLLFEPNDVDGLASQLDSIASDPDLWCRLSKEGKARADEHFSVERVIGKMLRLYEEVRGGEGTAPAALGSEGSRTPREGWLQRLRHRGGRLVDVVAVPVVRKISDAYFAVSRRKPSFGVSPHKRILFVMFTRGLGDAVLCSAALNDLKRKDPGARITVIASPYVLELLGLFRAVDKSVPFDADRARVSDVYRLVRRIRRLRFDVAVDVLADRSVLSALISFLSGAPDVVGFSVGFRSAFFNRRHPSQTEGVHFADSIRNMLIREGLAAEGPVLFEKALWTEKDRQRAISALAGSPGPVFCVHLGSRGVTQFRWAPDNWVTLLRLIKRRFGSTIALIGSGEEERLCKYVQERLDGDCVNVAGSFTIRETSAIIAESDLLMSIASGPLHMAVAMQVPAVYVGGGVDLVRWGAYGNSPIHRVVLQNEMCKPEDCRSCEKRMGACSKGIEPEAFFRAVEDAIEELNLKSRMR
jgi:ADP-heptose:LPS heptosyltransferase